MASLRVLAFDHERRPLQFDTWLDHLQLYLQSNSRDSVSLFDHTSSAALAPPATAVSATRSQWLTRDAAARLAIRNHLPLAECAHFGQHKTAQALYPPLPQLRTWFRYRAATPVEFINKNQPPMFITVHFKVTRLPDSLRSVRDHVLSLDPTSLTVDLLEQNLLTAETSAVAVGAARGTPRTPFFEGCSPSPLAPSYTSTSAVDVLGGSESGGGCSCGGSGGRGGSGSGGSCGGSGGVGGGGGGSGESGGSDSGGSGGGRTGAQRGGSGGGQRQRWSETPSPQELREWFFQRGASGGSARCLYVIHTSDRAGQTCGKSHTQHRCFSRLDDAAEGDCYRCVPPDLDIEAAALGASESSLLGTAPAEALHTFTLHSGASRCFFCNSTTVTPLSAPVPVRQADPSQGPVVACSSIVLPCPTYSSGSLTGLHLPSFSTNLMSTAALQDAMVTTTTPGGQRVSKCTCTRTGRHLATFTRPPGSNLYTLATEPPQHHRLGHPSLLRLRGMHSRLLVSGLPTSLPPLPPSLALPCLPCVEGRQRSAPHSSSFPPMTAPLQTLHMDVWGTARVSGQSHERNFLLVVDDYTRYTTVFPLCSKGQVLDVLIPWIHAVHLLLRERFCEDLPVLRLHSVTGGELSSDLLRDFCRGEGILQSFTLPDSPLQNGIAERHIGLVMEVARTALNLWPRISLLETSPTLRWTRKVGDASVFRVWGSRASVRDTSTDKLSACAIPCDVTFDESVPFYSLFPYRSAPSPPPPLFLPPGPPPVDPLPPKGPALSGMSQVDPLPVTAPVEGAGFGGAEPGGEECGGAEPTGVEPGGAEREGVEPGGAESEGEELGGTEPRGVVSSGGPAGASPRLSPQQLREWLVWRACLRSGATGAGGAGDIGAGGAGVTTGAGGTGEPRTAGVGGARAGSGEGGAGAGGARVGGSGEGCAGAGGARVVDPGGTVRPRPYFVPLLQQVLGFPSSTSLPPPLLCPPPDQLQLPLQPASLLSAPSPYTKQSGGLTERH
ncbi:unnamed protein product [Closterium sp. NIES-54]